MRHKKNLGRTFLTWTDVGFKKHIWILNNEAPKDLGTTWVWCKLGLFGWVFLIKAPEFSMDMHFKCPQCSLFSVFRLNQERRENVHSRLEIWKEKEIFDHLFTHSYLWGHIIDVALCQQHCSLNLNMYVKWMTLTFPQLCNHYNLITSNNVLQLGHRAEMMHVVTSLCMVSFSSSMCLLFLSRANIDIQCFAPL